MKEQTRTETSDRVWLWCHPAGSHNGQYGLPADSSITPAEAAEMMGISNLVYVVYGDRPTPPFEPHARELAAARRLVWSIVGDASSHRNDRSSDLDAVCALAANCRNVSGAIMDDFFLPQPSADGREARLSLAQTRSIRDALHAQPRPMDLWVVMYDQLIGRAIEPFLEACDVVTYWTWRADSLAGLEDNFSRVEDMAPTARKRLGIYMWDFGAPSGREIPADRMRHQCRLAERWLADGRIDGVIPLASCICDLDIAGVRYVRDWVAGLT
jgi:hypothetical protein